MEIRSSDDTPSNTNFFIVAAADGREAVCDNPPNVRAVTTAGTAPAINFSAWRRFMFMASSSGSSFVQDGKGPADFIRQLTRVESHAPCCLANTGLIRFVRIVSLFANLLFPVAKLFIQSGLGLRCGSDGSAIAMCAGNVIRATR